MPLEFRRARLGDLCGNPLRDPASPSPALFMDALLSPLVVQRCSDCDPCMTTRFSQRVGGKPPFISGLNEASNRLRNAAWNLPHAILLPSSMMLLGACAALPAVKKKCTARGFAAGAGA